MPNEQAEAYYQRVLRIDEQICGQQHLETTTDLEAYAKLLREMDREQEVLPRLIRAFADQEREKRRRKAD